MMRKTLILLLMLLPATVFAGTFTVTTNADSGPGSLREAIQAASDNGTTGQDKIVFNIPYTGLPSITITLLSQLPLLSSNLVIDGTTQPSATLGISDAKIKITLAKELVNQLFDCFYIYRASNVEIYGMYLDATDVYQFNSEMSINAITLFAAGNIIIGKPGKGNVIKGWQYGITRKYQYNNEDDNSTLNNITIKSNFIGLSTDGELDEPNQLSIDLETTDTVIVGGENKNEGNYFAAEQYDIRIGLPPNSTKSLYKIQNNTFNRNVKGTTSISETSLISLGIDGYNSVDSDPGKFKTIISNNLFGGTEINYGIILGGLPHKIKIYANKFGDEINQRTYVTNYWIRIGNCPNSCIIGDDDETLKNTFTKAIIAVSINQAPKVLITKDSFYCNVIPINNDSSYNWVIPSFITINNNKSNIIRGTAKPLAKIEVFVNHDCVSSDQYHPYQCQGKDYLEYLLADKSGNWSYNNKNSLPLVFTATADSSTSDFSNAIVNSGDFKVTGTTCGKANGSIKGVIIKSGAEWFWKNSSGQVVSTDTNLVNVKAGTYSFSIDQGSNVCAQMYYYVITDTAKPEIDSALLKITPAACGKNGSIYNPADFNQSWKYKWYDNSKHLVDSNFAAHNPTTGLLPGNYFLKVSIASDSTCFGGYGPFTVTNVAGASLNTDNIEITSASCTKSNGSIKNITYQNAGNNPYIAWVDSNNKVVSNTLDLLNVPTGEYRLKFKTVGGCDTIITQYYSIGNALIITYDTSKMIITPSSCKGNDGAIHNITSFNATTFMWVDTVSGKTVGNNEDISNIPPGHYRLFLSNDGCATKTNTITVPPGGFLTVTITQEIISDPNCDLDNGFVKPLKFTQDTSAYTFQWKDDATGNILSTYTSVYGLAAGHYSLYATDVNGCTQAVFSTPVIQHGKPVFIYSAMQVTGDTCNAGSGVISNVQLKDIYRTYTWAWFNAAQQAVDTTSAGIDSLHEGSYYAAVTDQFGCTVNSNTIPVGNSDVLSQTPYVADKLIPRYHTAALQVTNVQAGIYYLYDTILASIPISTSPTGTFVTPPVAYDKIFIIRLIRGDCLSNPDLVQVKVFDSTRITAPNAFSPNGDGINDTWRFTIKGTFEDFKIAIFNRYGQSVFTTNDVNKPWNGTVNGKPLPVGTYYYIIQCKGDGGRLVKLSGYVMIVR